MSTKVISRKLADIITQLLQKIPDLTSRIISKDVVRDYDKFFELYNINIFEILKDDTSPVQTTVTIYGILLGIGGRYNSVTTDVSMQDFSKFLFPDNIAAQQQALKFFQSLSLANFYDLFTLFNVGTSLTAINDDIPDLLLKAKCVLSAILTAYN